MSSPTPKPGTPQLQQAEREAIIDLLHLCLYGDAHVALKEREAITAAAQKIGWNPQVPLDGYAARSIAAARAAHENAGSMESFLRSAAERLQSRESRLLATDLCQQLFNADGALAGKESVLLREIRFALK